MPSKRKSDKHLPPCVYQKNGAYYFVKRKSIDGKYKQVWQPLGSSFSEAMSNYVKLVETPQTIITMHDLIDRYMKEVASIQRPNTYKCKLSSEKYLRVFFGDMSPSDVTQQHVYQYRDKRAEKAKVRVNREKALLSHMFKKAIEWGIISGFNPCTQVSRIPEHSRKVYIEDDAFEAFIGFTKNKTVSTIAELAYITLQRQGDLLDLKWSDADINSEGLHVSVNKTARNGAAPDRIIIEWTDELKSVIKKIKSIKRNVRGLHLFCNRKGEAYTGSGFQSLWQRAMNKAINEGVIIDRFTFHDIRHKGATDMEKLRGREATRKVLSQADEKTTAIYISGAQKVKPLK